MTAVTIYDQGKGMLGPFFSEIVKPINNLWNRQINKFWALNENLVKCAFYAAFLRTRNWVFVAASRRAFSSR